MNSTTRRVGADADAAGDLAVAGGPWATGGHVLVELVEGERLDVLDLLGLGIEHLELVVEREQPLGQTRASASALR